MAKLTMVRPQLATLRSGLRVTRATEPGQPFYSTPEWRALRDRLLD